MAPAYIRRDTRLLIKFRVESIPKSMRKIIHLDLDAFFCAVEELREPGLVGKPFAVGGKPDQRGVVASCSYAARQFGVRSAMPMARAVKVCPDLIILSGNHRLYEDYSEQVMQYLRTVTPWVEQISIDEAFMDVSAMPEQSAEIAHRLQTTIRNELKLPCSLGVASNKLVAKIATDVGKLRSHSLGPPYAITVVAPGEEAEFLAPLPVESLWGVGPKTAERLETLGVLTIGDLANQEEIALARIFGKMGPELVKRAQGIDDSPIITSHEVKSISQEVTFTRDVRDEIQLRQTLMELSDSVGNRLRQSQHKGTTVKLKLRWPDFTTLTRQITLPQPTDLDADIQRAAISLFEKVWRRGRAVRLLGVGMSGFNPASKQLSLWDIPSKKEKRVQEVVDGLQEKFGAQAIHRGRQAKRKHG